MKTSTITTVIFKVLALARFNTPAPDLLSPPSEHIQIIYNNQMCLKNVVKCEL